VQEEEGGVGGGGVESLFLTGKIQSTVIGAGMRMLNGMAQ